MKTKIEEAASRFAHEYEVEKIEKIDLDIAFEEGANFALENQWHNLKDNPNDLPEYEEAVLVKYYCGLKINRRRIGDYLMDKYGFMNILPMDEAIAWMHIPEFKTKQTCSYSRRETNPALIQEY